MNSASIYIFNFLEAELETIIITSVLVTVMVAGICLLVCTFTYRYVANRRRQAG